MFVWNHPDSFGGICDVKCALVTVWAIDIYQFHFAASQIAIIVDFVDSWLAYKGAFEMNEVKLNGKSIKLQVLHIYVDKYT